jgi:hypothetical protein
MVSDAMVVSPEVEKPRGARCRGGNTLSGEKVLHEHDAIDDAK